MNLCLTSKGRRENTQWGKGQRALKFKKPQKLDELNVNENHRLPLQGVDEPLPKKEPSSTSQRPIFLIPYCVTLVVQHE